MNVALYYHYSFNTAVEKKEKKRRKKGMKGHLLTMHTVLQPSIRQDNLLPYKLYSS